MVMAGHLSLQGMSGSIARGDTHEAKDLVAQLSVASIDYDHMVMTLWPKAVGSAADRLVAIGRESTPYLLEALADPERSIPANLVLCGIWYPDRSFSGEEPLYQDGEIIGFRYHVKGLRWTISGRDGIVEVDRETMMEAVHTWCRHVPRRFRSDVCKLAG
jgi:hypothetical protein